MIRCQGENLACLPCQAKTDVFYPFLLHHEKKTGDVLGGPVVKTSSSNAGDAGSIPGQGVLLGWARVFTPLDPGFLAPPWPVSLDYSSHDALHPGAPWQRSRMARGIVGVVVWGLLKWLGWGWGPSSRPKLGPPPPPPHHLTLRLG